MKLAEVCVRRPVFAVMLIAFLVTLGIFSFRDLGVDLFPKADQPSASVMVRLPGATPEEVNSQVVMPIEEAISSVSGIDELRVYASEGNARFFIQFVLDRNIDQAVTDVREKVAGAMRNLPPNVQPPIITKADPDSSPVISFVVAGDRSIRELTEIADRQLRRALETVDGVGEVSMSGTRRREIRVFVDGDKLTAYNLTAQNVSRALQSENIEAPGGRMVRGLTEFGVRTLGRVDAVEQFNDIIITNVKGSPVRIRDVGRAEDGEEEQRTYAAIFRPGQKEKEAVLLDVRRQTGTNTVKIVDAVKVKMAQLQRTLPAGVHVQTLRDDSVFIKASVGALEEHLLIGSLLASLVVLIFIRNWRTVLIASVAIPTSVVATFTLMRYMDFTLNNMTLLALTLAVGIVIDDAIIVLENIFRFIEEKGYEPKPAAIEATQEIGLAVMATTISLVIIFVPIAFMTGFAKRFVNQFGWTMAMAIMVSLLVSFTLTPMMSSLLLKRSSNGEKKKEHQTSRESGFFHWQDVIYGKMLNWSLDHRAIVVGVCTLVFCSTFWISKFVGRDWVPNDDMSEFWMLVDLPEGASMRGTIEPVVKIARQFTTLPGVEFVYPYTHGTMGHAHVVVRLVAPEDRKLSSEQVADQARKMIAAYPNVRGRVLMANALGMGEGNFPIRLNINGPDLYSLVGVSKGIAKEMKRDSALADVDVGLNLNNPEMQIKIDRSRASELGVRVADVATAIRLMMSGEDQVSTYKEGAEQYDVTLQLLPEQRDNPDMLSRLIVPSTKLGQVRLDSIAALQHGAGPTRIERFNRQFSTSVTAAPATGGALDSAARATMAAVRNVDLPPGFSTRFSGQVKVMDETSLNLIMALLLASIFMYMVLAAQFESLLHPFIIMLTLPLSLPFALFSLWITGNTLNLWSALGILLLLGIVKKNGILQIDYTNRLREQGLGLREAIVEANHVRLRPILMTTFSIVAGLIPTAVGIGAGSKQRAAIAITIIGGQTLCLTLTLLLVPVAYSLMEESRAWLATRFPVGRPKEVRA